LLAIILFLLLLGLLMLVIEAFIPGGIVATVGALLILGSGFLFVQQYGWNAGIVYFGISAVIGFCAWLFGFLYFARRLALAPPVPEEEAEEKAHPLVGKHGRVVQILRPTGTIEIEGHRHPARSDLAVAEIPVGTEVQVIGIDSSYLVVEPVHSDSQEGNKP
jgi:membrane-bound serine protease (ClpP class)